MNVCSVCDFKTKSYIRMRQHILRNSGHIDCSFELGHLIIRGKIEDEERRQFLRDRLEKAQRT